MRHNQMVLGIHGDLHVVADDDGVFTQPGSLSDSCTAARARVECADSRRGMKRTLNEIATTSSTKPPPTAATARTRTATKCGKSAPPLQRTDRRGLRRGPPFRDRSSVCRAPELELVRPRHAVWCYPYAFCNCAAQRLQLSPEDAGQKIPPRGRERLECDC